VELKDPKRGPLSSGAPGTVWNPGDGCLRHLAKSHSYHLLLRNYRDGLHIKTWWVQTEERVGELLQAGIFGDMLKVSIWGNCPSFAWESYLALSQAFF
jgi:hypothetical protein